MRCLRYLLLVLGCLMTFSACVKSAKAPALTAPHTANTDVQPLAADAFSDDWSQEPEPGAQVYNQVVPAMDLRAPQPAESLLLRPDCPEVAAATQVLGVKLDWAMPINSAAHHVVMFYPEDLTQEVDDSYPREYLLADAHGGTEAYPAGLYCAAVNQFDNTQYTPEANKDLGLIIFRPNPAQGVQLIDSLPVPGAVWRKICLFDADADGWLELVMSALATDPGGEVVICTIQPDGKLILRSDEIRSAEGDLCLKDLDQDGHWEVITRQWKTWIRYSHWKVYSLDRTSQQWQLRNEAFPAFLAEQLEFYRLYDTAYLQFLAERKATGKSISALLGPQWILLTWRGTPYVLDREYRVLIDPNF